MKEKIYFEDVDFTNNAFDHISVKLMEELRIIPYIEKEEEIICLLPLGENYQNDSIIKLIYNKNPVYEYMDSSEFDKTLAYLSKSNFQGFYETIINDNINLVERTVYENKEEFYNSEIKNNIIVRTLDNIIEKAILSNASDVHFEPNQEKVIVRMRIDGELKKNNEYNSEIYSQIVSRIKVLSNLDITKHLQTQDGKFVYKYSDDTYDIRVSILPTLYGERISLRILDTKNTKINLDDLYIDKQGKENLFKVLNSSSGIILVVGPTGSGKTTTLYSMLKARINEKINIITVEDPIEYSIEGVSQVQVDSNIGLTFNETLRSVLRQDPDIFMIGEIRDEESAKIAIRSATTGHLVFSTLHANDAITSISRLLDMGIAPYLIASSLKLVIFQKLVKKRCQKCLDIIGGCSHCNYTGYNGRIAIGEVLYIDDEMKNAIINNFYNDLIDDYIKRRKFIRLTTNLNKAKKEKIIMEN